MLWVCEQVELKSGVMYRGELLEAEDNWNVQLKNVDATSKASDTIHFVWIAFVEAPQHLPPESFRLPQPESYSKPLPFSRLTVLYDF